MAEEESKVAVVSFIKDGKRKEWDRFVETSIDQSDPEKKRYAVFILTEVGKMLTALGQGTAPAEVVKLASQETTLMQIGVIVINVVVFSNRGEEFRAWWNQWHDRSHPKSIFNASQINVKGHSLTLVGKFDPELPLTKHPKYLEIVNAAIEAAKAKA